MDTKELEYFLALVQQENISRAADLLNISQSALSKIVGKLEKEVGVKLFDRHGNRISLNDYGRNFAHYAARSLEVLENGFFTTRQSRYDTRGVISFSCHAFPEILAPVITDYHFLNPNVQIKVSRHSDKTQVSKDEEDFLLCSGQESKALLENTGNWVSWELFREKSVILISERYRTFPEDCHELPMSALKEEKFVGMSESSPLFSDITFRLCSAAGFIPTIAFETNHYLFKVRIVGEGRAIAILPECCVKTAQQLYPDIHTFQIQGIDTSRSIYLLRRKKLLLSEAALDFWNFVLDFYHLEPDTQD